MGLLTIIRKARLKEKQVRILMLGLDNAGKTTICKAILGEDVDEVSPTLGFNIRTIVHQGFSLNVWDIGGQTSLRPYWRNYFEQTDAVVWVVDSSDRARMEDCRRELHELLKEERLVGASLLVFANKQDIANAMTVKEISSALELSALSSSHHWTIQPCSARYARLAPHSSASSDSPTPSIATSSSSPLAVKVDPRIMEGLDWVVAEVGSRVYYGVQNSTVAPETVRPVAQAV
ncbi:ADP-ribosylation factor-like protein 2 [Rhodotorula toruloides]|uniref:ADP-ribosylation factor-like protein 2 n=1 Tax=Rhodotorula toruloides TaxID=5286 RepID=A0A511KDS8_RHOTO|nr:ADP-ribosylation factor-like protein 2 [Rhodotorula toruloides]